MGLLKRWRWFVFALLAAGAWLALRPEAPPEIEPGSALVLKLEGAYVDGPENKLQAFLGDEEQSLLAAVARLRKAARDERIATVVLRIRELQIGWAQAQELRAAIAALQQQGKQTVALLEYEGYGNAAYFLGSAAQTVIATPGAHNPFVGLAAEFTYLGGLLEKIGVGVEYERIGRYKSAVESLAHNESTPEAREVRRAIFDSIEGVFVGGVAEARGLTPAKVREIIDGAPGSPPAMREAGLVDAVQFYDEAMAELGDPPVVQADEYDRVTPEQLGIPEAKARIAVVYGTGPVVTGTGDSGFGGERVMAAETTALHLREAAEDDDIAAIIFRVNSPGGSPLASDLIAREVARARAAGKPVVVSMSDVAGSGGYFVACGADAIVSHGATLTGSIGVFALRPVLRGLYEKLDIGVETITRGEKAELMLSADKLSPQAREALRRQIAAVYELFLDRVEAGRGLPRETVDGIGQGRVWTGEQALRNGLVDELGGYIAARDRAKELAGIDAADEVALVEYPGAKTLLQNFAELMDARSLGRGVGAAALAQALPLPLPEGLRQMLLAQQVLPAGKPVMLMPAWVEVR